MTTNITSSKRIPMGVSDTILTKAPRFFGSSRSILTELFQNAYRAHAENVWITWNPESRVLEFKDDGRGCQPEDLVTVGESGWDEDSPAIDPAGIGVFSILRPEYCEQVTYRSQNWSMTISAQNLERAEAEAHYLEAAIAGMIVQITLTSKADFAREQFVQSARGRYPMNVTWQELPKESVVVKTKPILDVAHWTTLYIEGIGKLELGKSNAIAGERYFAVWQHAVIHSGALKSALINAAQKLHPLANRIFQSISCVLDVAPNSGIRPKLPDRDDLIHDTHLDAAAEKIVAQVINYLLKPLHPELWPDRVISYSYSHTESELPSGVDTIFMEVPEEAVIRKLVKTSFVQEDILVHFGYKPISWDELTSYSDTTIQDDGMQLEIEWDIQRHYVRNTPIAIVHNDLLAQSLCSQGVYAVAQPKSDGTDEIRIVDMVCGPDSLVAFAKEIIVNGTLVKWLLNSNYCTNYGTREKEDEPMPAFITTLTPAEFYQSVKAEALHDGLWVSLCVWQIYRDGNIYEYAELHDAEYDLQVDDLANDLLEDALAIGAPHLLIMAQRKDVYESFLENISGAARSMNTAYDVLDRNKRLLEDGRLSGNIKGMEKRLSSLHKQVQRQIKLMNTELDSFMGIPKKKSVRNHVGKSVQ